MPGLFGVDIYLDWTLLHSWQLCMYIVAPLLRLGMFPDAQVSTIK